jgi:hypothetical protein
LTNLNGAKRLALLRELAPVGALIGVLVNAKFPALCGRVCTLTHWSYSEFQYLVGADFPPCNPCQAAAPPHPRMPIAHRICLFFQAIKPRLCTRSCDKMDCCRPRHDIAGGARAWPRTLWGFGHETAPASFAYKARLLTKRDTSRVWPSASTAAATALIVIVYCLWNILAIAGLVLAATLVVISVGNT